MTLIGIASAPRAGSHRLASARRRWSTRPIRAASAPTSSPTPSSTPWVPGDRRRPGRGRPPARRSRRWPSPTGSPSSPAAPRASTCSPTTTSPPATPSRSSCSTPPTAPARPRDQPRHRAGPGDAGPPVVIVYRVSNGIDESRATMTLRHGDDFNNPPVVYDAFGSAEDSGSVVVDVLEGAYDPDGDAGDLVVGASSAGAIPPRSWTASGPRGPGPRPKVVPFEVRTPTVPPRRRRSTCRRRATDCPTCSPTP